MKHFQFSTDSSIWPKYANVTISKKTDYFYTVILNVSVFNSLQSQTKWVTVCRLEEPAFTFSQDFFFLNRILLLMLYRAYEWWNMIGKEKKKRIDHRKKANKDSDRAQETQVCLFTNLYLAVGLLWRHNFTMEYW